MTIDEALAEIRRLKEFVREQRVDRRVAEIREETPAHIEARMLFDRAVEHLGLDRDTLMGRTGVRRYQEARAMICWALVKIGKHPNYQVAKVVGRRRSSLVHAIRRVEVLRRCNPHFANRLQTLVGEEYGATEQRRAA